MADPFKSTSRALNRLLTGENVMLCASAYERGWRVRRVLDAVLQFYDGPDHCARMAEYERREGGASCWRVRGRGFEPREDHARPCALGAHIL
jgi:hypothetical protein